MSRSAQAPNQPTQCQGSGHGPHSGPEPERPAEVEDPGIPQRPLRDPHKVVRQHMADLGLPPELLDQLPRRWVRLGRVALLHLPDGLRPWARQLGGAYAHALGVETVGEVERIRGELRQPCLRLYHGSRTRTEVREHGLRFRLDVARMMWSPGNVGWRAGTGETGNRQVARLYALDQRPGTVVDMFAGVGYFTLPLAREYPDARVVAVEKNPEAHAYLKENITLNRLTNVETVLGDCRHLPGPGAEADGPLSGGAQLVHMGFVGGTADYLPHAIGLLAPAGGVVFYHESYPNRKLGLLRHSQLEEFKAPEPLVSELQIAVNGAGRSLEGLQVAKVKSYSPGVTHLVARLKVK